MISDVSDKVRKFLETTLESEGRTDAVRIVSVDKTNSGWIAEAEVAVKNLVLPEYRVFEKEHYVIKLDANLEISSYKRVKNTEEELESSDYGS
jgi:hypothetical protein